MQADQRTLVVIPAWNESGSIGEVVKEIRSELPSVDVLVIDDGSTDETAAIAAGAGAMVARLPYNLGVGGAMRLGYRYGHQHDYDVVVQIDADGQHDPKYVPRLLAALHDADLVIGARFAGAGEYRVSGPRRWAMRLLSVVVSGLADTKLTDTTSGFRAANRQMTEAFAKFYPVEYLGDTVETLIYAARGKFRVTQIPVAMRVRMTGEPSQSPVKAALYFARALTVLLLALIRR